MATSSADQSRTREASLALRFFWTMLVCSALARLAARFLPVLETSLLVAGFVAFVVACYFHLTDPGSSRAAKDRGGRE